MTTILHIYEINKINMSTFSTANAIWIWMPISVGIFWLLYGIVWLSRSKIFTPADDIESNLNMSPIDPKTKVVRSLRMEV